MRRELAIALRARVTWVVTAVGALLVGHGFVLAVDLFSSSSRSAIAGGLEAREMDPLAGVVRPTLGGFDLVLVLLAPLIAARTLAVEKERRTFGALCLAEASTTRVVLEKTVAALVACSASFAAPLVLLSGFVLSGGHLDLVETSVAFGGEVWRALVVVAASLAGAAWTGSLAQAAVAGVAVSLTSWAIDAADGFVALAWLGGASAWSIERKIAPFGRGIVSTGACLWLGAAFAAALALACAGASFGGARRRLGASLAILVAGASLMAGASRLHRSYDLTEGRRGSFPAPVVAALRSIPGPIELEVHLDREDARRQQLESDVLGRLVLARPDVVVRMPLDEAPDRSATQREASYGRVLIRAGGGERETRSMSRRELVTLILEAAGRRAPAGTTVDYPGHPAVITGPRRTLLLGLAYFALPLGILATGLFLDPRRTA